MKIFVFAIIFALLGISFSYPLPEEGGSKTWGAIKDFFDPVTSWVSDDLPQKTPSDLVGDAQDVVGDVQTWASNNAVIQGIGDAVRPVRDWAADGVQYVKDKPMTTLYGDVKETVSGVDESVGGWIDRNLG